MVHTYNSAKCPPLPAKPPFSPIFLVVPLLSFLSHQPHKSALSLSQHCPSQSPVMGQLGYRLPFFLWALTHA